jgi:hypothetical protein
VRSADSRGYARPLIHPCARARWLRYAATVTVLSTSSTRTRTPRAPRTPYTRVICRSCMRNKVIGARVPVNVPNRQHLPFRSHGVLLHERVTEEVPVHDALSELQPRVRRCRPLLQLLVQLKHNLNTCLRWIRICTCSKWTTAAKWRAWGRERHCRGTERCCKR